MGLDFPQWVDQLGHAAGQALGLGEADQNKRDDQQRMNDEKAKWDADRAIVNNEWSGLLGEYGSDQFDERAIKVLDPFETMSHEEIYNAVKDVDPGVINSKADGWRSLTKKARDAVEIFSKGVEEDITNYWNGQSGTAAIEGTRAFATSFTTIAACFQMVAHGLDLMEGHLAQAKNSVGKPDNTTVGDKIINAIPFQSVIKGPEYRATEAQENARFVMTTYYRPGAEDVDGHTPVLPQPKNPVDGKDEGWKPPVNPPGTSGWPPGGGGKNPGEEIENGGGENNGNGEESNPSDDTTDDTTPQSTTPASTTPASTTPASTQLPNSDLPRGTSGLPGGVGTGGMGSGGGPGGSGVPSTPGMGRSVPGGGANTQGKAAASTGAGAGSGRNGRMGMPGMGMPAGRGGGKGEDDDEHKTPDYLIYDHGDELLGSQPPALPPGGVIGG
ncbi:hypothetical protein [Nocardia cyriacigeorgica]|uniref:hypothetical protein n=1 Tax=Nocardia cyriacigeorgica TaxID=135487 RepID=UPI001894E1BA|nr:hypothetical protein [Nocardia cyriacigeorgica]MBF6456199.1 hypothetical protein [Nocardia cyriacigeorgica]MBF6477728.1 hypothetical protein [Nocardia cyriacigeorgica]MBF6553061.1 hypothetical protein [Nocardia cyriacigeorgica]